MYADGVFHFADHAAMSREAATFIVDNVNLAIEKKGLCNLVLAGGTTPIEIYRRLPKILESADCDHSWNSVNMFLGDERVLNPGSPDTNREMIEKNLLSLIPQFSGTANFPDTSSLNPTIIASMYHQLISSFFPAKSTLPFFDLVLLGIGEDGHTASIFPGNHFAQQKRSWVFPVTDPNIQYPRVSLSTDALSSSALIVFIAAGKTKHRIIRRVINGDPSLPASRIKPETGRIMFFISENAYGEDQ